MSEAQLKAPTTLIRVDMESDNEQRPVSVLRLNLNPPEAELEKKFSQYLEDELEGEYASADELPDWMQERLAILYMINPNDSDSGFIPGAGRRAAEKCFWVDPAGVPETIPELNT